MKEEINLRKVSNKCIFTAKNRAGPRYSPGINSNFPSLEIKELIESCDGLSRNSAFWDKISYFRKEFEKLLSKNLVFNKISLLPKVVSSEAKKCRMISRRVFKRICQIEKLKNNTFRSRNIYDLKDIVRESQNTASDLYSKILRRKDDPNYKQDKLWVDESHESHIQNESREILDTIYEFDKFIISDAVKYCDKPISLLLGRAGTGKTHFLCDLAHIRQGNHKLTYLFISNNLRIVDNDPWKTIISYLKIKITKRQFISGLKKAAKDQNERVIFIFDAINEANRSVWKRFSKALITEISRYREFGLILSCRTPFQKFLFSKGNLGKINAIAHPGFYNIEFDAQKEFFKYYRLPEITIPLLDNEFSNPLFLKIFCESLNRIIIKKDHRQLKEITSGQRGMTYIFENFIIEKERKITSELNSEGNTRIFSQQNWLWGKGANPGIVKDIAKNMALNNKDYIHISELIVIICKYIYKKKYDKIIKGYLISEGILLENYEWINNKNIEVCKFGYQKISDHLIARELLKQYDLKKVKQINILYEEVRGYPNLFEAVMIEFPKRSKGQELLAKIDNKNITYSDLEIFIEGLYWREGESITKETSKIVNWCLADDQLKDKMFEALYTVGTKYSSKYNSLALDRFLNSLGNVDRDVQWSEFIRHRYATSSVYKVINWVIEHEDLQSIPELEAKNILILIKWILTTNNRKLRDQATEALVLLGINSPTILFNETLNSLSVNDIYVPERLIAACYGICMRIYNQSNILHDHKTKVVKLAKLLYKNIFSKNADYSTTHVLIRDYASNIIRIALILDPKALGKRQISRVTPPYKDGGIRNWKKSKDKNEGEYRDGNGPIQMDFGNYTLGRLVNIRNNYDFEHHGYKEVRANIFWRLYNLGYSLEKFGEIDKEIARESYYYRSDNPGQVDRYGKKYSWIAYFELYGYRQDRGLLDEWDDETRPSDCDIDPSFPNFPNSNWIVKRNLIHNPSSDINNWIKAAKCPGLNTIIKRKNIFDIEGPWILLNGALKQVNDKACREHSIWLHGQMINSRDINKVDLDKFTLREIQDFSHSKTSTYTFAGEVSWNKSWPRNGKEVYNLKIGEKEKKVIDKELVILENGEELRPHRRNEVLKNIVELGDNLAKIEKYLLKNNLHIFERSSERIVKDSIFKRIKYLTPVRIYNWESYHCAINPGQYIHVPAREIIDFAKLKIELPQWDFIDPTGKKGIIVNNAGEQYRTGEKLVYIREDILKRFLKKYKYELVWFVSGERQVRNRGAFSTPKNTDNQKGYKTYCKVIKYSEL